MIKFKPLKTLEECKLVQAGEMIGVAQVIFETIPSRCINNDGRTMELIGNMDNTTMIKYELLIKDILGFSADGSIIFRRTAMDRTYFEKEDNMFENYKQIWEGSRK